MIYEFPRILPCSDTAICVEFGDEISEAVNARVYAFGLLLEQTCVSGICETVPTYRSLLIHYDPAQILCDSLCALLQKIVKEATDFSFPEQETISVPVLYGGEFGPDLSFVAEYHQMTPEEVIRRHTAPEYLIHMIGFLPGFAYLGGMDPQLATPRLETPRVRIDGGSVGIAGGQTGIYPMDSPGGWRLIGRTPLRLYDPHREKPVLFDAGQRIRFYSITPREFQRLRQREEGAHS